MAKTEILVGKSQPEMWNGPGAERSRSDPLGLGCGFLYPLAARLQPAAIGAQGPKLGNLGRHVLEKGHESGCEEPSAPRAAMRQMHMSARAYHRILKLARTIADLAGSDAIQAAHLVKATPVGRDPIPAQKTDLIG